NHEHTKMATIFIYDGYEGGIGLTGKAFDLIEEITRMTHELVRDCTCEEGCPACIYSPKCGNDNKPLNKEGTLFILNQMLDLMEIER
ncbi:MAG: Zn-binding domain-containing protein, partial [Methanobacterium sp.]